MPTYQYACTDAECGNRFELVQSFTDPAASECPSCAGPVRKVYSAVGVVFKGSGFYRTDSRASASDSGKKSESKSESKSAAKSESKSESKSADSKSADSKSASSSPAKAAASA